MHDVLRWVEVHPGLAAWVQAVGSIFAVTAAASLPFIHGYLTEKRETKVRLAALFALAQQSVTLLEDLAEAMKTESGMRDYMHLGVTGEWTELRAMLASFPLWDVVQQDLATQIGHLRHAVTVGHSIAETIPPGDIADSNFDIDRSHIEGGRILAIDARCNREIAVRRSPPLAWVAAPVRYAIFATGGDRPQEVPETRLAQSGEPGASAAVAALTGRGMPGSTGASLRVCRKKYSNAQSA